MREEVEKIIEVLFLGIADSEWEWDSFHRKVIANITKKMSFGDRKVLYTEVLYELDMLSFKVNSKQKQTIKRFIFPKGKLRKEQEEEFRILSRSF